VPPGQVDEKRLVILRTEPLGPAFGARIEGVNLQAALDRETIEALMSAWERHRVLLFRGQAIDDRAHARLARMLGTPARFERSAGASAESPEIYGSGNTDDTGNLLPPDDGRAQVLTINWSWHVDGCYRATPNKGVVLRAIQVPVEGGDTVFADLEAAYIALPAGMKRRIERLECRHSFAHMISRCGMPPVGEHETAELPAAVHPLVREHSSGRRSLFLSPPYMEAIEGFDYASTQSLVAELTEWATQDRFLCRHRWQAGDVLLWDNGWTMHRVLPYDLANDKRVMRGATLLGTDVVGAVAHA
jgi:alpha-ketoglutarate-dependent taurine dioxygenase